jgi:hypothetical protein
MPLSELYRKLSTPHAPTRYAIPLRHIVGYGFMEHGWAKLAQRTGLVHRHPTRDGDAPTWAVGLGHHRGGANRRRRGAHWCLHPADQYPDGRRTSRGHLHGSHAERIQFNQAAIFRCDGRAFPAAGLRSRPPLPRRAHRSEARRFRLSPHTKASRDSMTPSVTRGAMMGSAACKRHATLTRDSSAIMIVLPRNRLRAGISGNPYL